MQIFTAANPTSNCRFNRHQTTGKSSYFFGKSILAKYLVAFFISIFGLISYSSLGQVKVVTEMSPSLLNLAKNQQDAKQFTPVIVNGAQPGSANLVPCNISQLMTGPTVSGHTNTGQTFTATCTGTINSIEVYYNGLPGATGNTNNRVLNIRNGNLPTSPIIHTQVIPYTSIAIGLLNIFTLTVPVAITNGQIYGWEISDAGNTSGAATGVGYNGTNPYPGGDAWFSGSIISGLDITFNVIMNTCTAPASPVITAGSSTSICGGGSVVLTAAVASSTDLNFTNSTTGTQGIDQWQSFTPTVTADLIGIAIYTNGCPPGSASTFTLYAGVGTGGSVLNTQTVTISGCNASFVVNLPNISLTAGSNYTFRFQNVTNTYLLANNTAPGSYFSNSYGLNPGWKLNFTTTMIVPLGAVQWFNNGGLIAGAAAATYTATTAANYTCKTSSSGCYSLPSNSISVTNTVPVTPTITAGGPVNFCAPGSVTLTAAVSPITDLSFTTISTGTAGVDQWQSFVPNVDGLTTAIQVYLNGSATAVSETFNIYKGTGTFGTLVYSQAISITGASAFYNIPIPGGVHLTPGTDYTFQLTGSSLSLIANNGSYGSYYSSSYGLNPAWRLDFKTIVTPYLTPQWYNGASLIVGATATTYAASTSGTYTSVNGVTGCYSPASNGITVTAATSNTWSGATNNNWFTASNWSCGNVPIATSDVIIPSGTPNPCVISGGTAQIHNLTINAGATLTNNATLNVNGGGTVTTNGTYKGSGTFSGALYANNGGVVAPGNSPGCTVFGAGYTNGTGTEQIEIGGVTPCTLHDQLQVTGTATLSGTLDVVLFGGFIPSCGQSYKIMTSTTLSGTFTTINYPALPAGLTWGILYNSPNPGDVTLTVTGNPVATATPASQTTCSGTAITTIVLTSTVASTTYAWTRDNPVVTGIANSGTGNISGTLTNPTNVPITVTFTITPTSGTCAGAPITATVTVNPTPDVAQPANQVVCNNAPTAPVIFTGSVTGTTFNWTNNTPSIGLAASGTGNIASFAATNATAAPVVATVTITPTYSNGGAGSTITMPAQSSTITPNVRGYWFTAPTNFTITSLRVPTDASAGNQSIAVLRFTGNTPPPVFASTTNAFTTLFLTQNDATPGNIAVNIPVNAGEVIGIFGARADIGSYGNGSAGITIAGFPVSTVRMGMQLPLSSNAPQSIWQEPTSPNISRVFFDYTTTGVICTGTPKTFTYTVNPTPTAVATPASQTTCSGTAITPIVITGNAVAGVVYNWTRDNTGTVTGIAASGAGNISGTLTNTTNTPITVTFTITPTANGCPGTPVTATVLVNPTPTVNAVPNQVLCNSAATTAVTFTGAVTAPPGTVYNWTNTQTSIGLAASGTGNIASFTATNATAAPVVATITVTPSYTNAGTTCNGTPTSFTITVNPTPTAVATPASQTICSATAITTIVISGNAIAGVVYNWTRDNVATVTGIAASGAGNISGTLTNTINTPITVTFTITPTANGCPGTPVTATVTVNPTPDVNQPANQVVCNNAPTAPVTFTGSVAGTVFNWTNSDPAIGLAASGSGNIASFTAINTGTAPVVATVTVTPSTAASGTQTFNYTGASQTWIVPAGVTSVTINAFGAEGGSAGNNSGWDPTFAMGGDGGNAAGTLAVIPGQVLTIYVGGRGNLAGAGQGGFNGGGLRGSDINTTSAGGGASDVRIAPAGLADRRIVAAGGGGAEWSGFARQAGQGGGLTGGVNGGGDSPADSGGPGTQVGGGAAGADACNGSFGIPNAGGFGFGGAATNGHSGAGGGGYYGGGSGGCDGHGGGGSSYLGGVTGGSTTAGVRTGDGFVTISYIGIVCTGTPRTFTYTVNPTPTATATPASQTICSATPITTVVISGNAIAGVVYNWTRDNVATVTGIAASGAGNISGTLTNTINTPITVTFTITPTANGCPGTPVTATVTVNPIPDVTQPANQVVCNGAPTAPVTFTGAVTGTVFNWTNNTPSIGLAASGSGNIASFTAINTGTAPVVATVTVTPSTGSGSPISNGGFETGTLSSWTVLSNVPPPSVSNTLPHTGTFAAFLGTPGAGEPFGDVSIYQQFTVPAIGGTLSYWYRPFTTDGISFDWQDAYITNTGNVVLATIMHVCSNSQAWTNVNYNMAAFAGQTVRVQFLVHQDGFGDETSMFLDDVLAPSSGPTCTGTPKTFTYTVNPTPTAVATPASQTVCSATPITTVVISGNAVAGVVYNWTRNNTATVTGIAASGAGNISGTLTNTTNTPITVTFTITPTANGCAGTPVTATVLVNPTPNAVATPASQTICSGATITTISITGNVAGTVYNWVRDNTVAVTGIAASGAGNISGALTNTTTAPVTVTFTITPTANGCAGTPVTATVLVNPTPTAVATPASQTTCSGSAITPIVLSSGVGNMVITAVSSTWADGVTLQLKDAANTTVLSAGPFGFGANYTSPSIPATNPPYTFSIQATIGDNYADWAIKCNSNPLVNGCIRGSGSAPACATATGSYSLPGISCGSGVAGTTFNWVRDNPIVTGIPMSGSGTPISGTLTNPTNLPITVTFTITPTANGCPGTPITATVVVNPIPTVNAVANQVVCNGAPTTAVTFTGAVTNPPGTVYNWTNNTTSIGLAASGTGNIASFTAINTGTSPVVATITVTPSYTNAGTTCTGTSTTFTITVNPTATVTVPANAFVCNGSVQPTGTYNFSTTATGGVTTYSWTNNNITIGLGGSGTGNSLPTFTATNNGTAPITGTITVTPTFTNGGVSCPGTPNSFSITVNPTPNATATPASQTICSGATITTIVNTGTVPGTVFNWTRDNTATATGIAASGTGNISGSLTNTTNGPVLVTFTITPSYTNGGTTCTGAPVTATVLVNPLATVNPVPNQTVCNGDMTAPVNFTSPTTGGTIVYNWTNNTPSIGLAAAGTGNITAFTAINTSTAPVTATITITPTYTNGGISCAGTPSTFTITVNPSGQVNQPASQVVCNNTPTAPVIFTTTTPGTVFNWTNNTTSIGLAAIGTGNIASFIATNVTNAPVVATIIVTPVYTGSGGPVTGPAFYIRNSNPWGQTSNDAAMTAVFGAPNWTAVNYAVNPATVFVPGTKFVFIEGSDANALAMNAFITTNITTIQNWVSAGGRLFMNAAPNQGGNMNWGFGGVTCVYPFFSSSVTATVPGHPIYTGPFTPVTTAYTGTSFAHASLTGGSLTNLMNGNAPGQVLGTLNWGSGSVMFGTMTTVNFHSPAPQAQNLRQNIIAFAATPTINCPGPSKTFTITVNPTPTVNPVANQVVCHGSPTAAVNFTGFVPGTVYNWTNNNTSIGLAGSGSGNIASFIAVNNGPAPVVATITVTPTYTNAGVTCSGASIAFTITVNPQGQVSLVANQAVCNGSPTAPVNFTTNVPGTVFNWTNNNTSIGLGASGTGNIPSFIGTNAGNTPNVGTITVTPTYTNGGVSCVGQSQTFTITVNPTPVVNPVASQVVCNGSPTANINFTSPVSGGVMIYNWTNTTPSIGLPASGTGNISPFIATNATNAPVVATITVTMSYTNGGTTCVSAPVSFTITVNPTPTVNQPANQSVCANTATAPVNFTGTVAGTVFNWTNNNTSIGLAASGTGNIASFIALNATSLPVVATIVVTPFYTNAGVTCSGASKTFTITVNPIPTVAAVSNKAYCTGATTLVIPFNGTPGNIPGTVYNWTNSNTGIGLAASGTGDIQPFVTTNATNGPLVATITVTPVGPGGCGGTPITFTITVNPIPIVNPVAGQVVCNGSPTAVINFTSPTTGPTGALSFQWTNSAPSIGLAANGTGNIPSFIATNTGVSPVTALITVTPVYTNAGITCTGTSQTFTIVVNPTPTVNSVANQTVCNGSNTAAVNFTGSVFGTIYNWTNNNTSIGLAASGAGNIASFVATNAGTTAQVATITVTPNFSNGVTCPGTPITFTITVNPIPDVNPVASQTVCAGATVTQAFSGSVAGAVYNWTNSNTAIGLAASGTGNLNFVSTNTTGAPLTGTIIVTPTYTNGGGSCTGTSQTFTITVNPVPTVNAVLPQVLCNGANTTPVSFTGAVAGTVYNWTNSNTTIGLAASGTGNIPSFIATNVTAVVQTATITVTPSYTNAGTTCTGTPITFTMTVNPTPAVNTIANQTVCNGTATTAVTITGPVAGTVYNWTNNNTSIGLGASGTGTIPSFTAINTGSVAVTATITITPTFTNGGISCTGVPTTFTITVTPAANVNQPADQILCNGSGTAPVIFTGSVAGTVYNWTNNNTAIGLGASGTGNIPGFIATNTTATPITATITVTPSSGSACTGASVSFTITVNPTPSVNAIANQTVCAGSATAAVTISGPVANTVYTWTNSNTTIGLGASGTGNIPSFIAINPTGAPVTATITVSASYTNGGITCTGATRSFTITVNPLPNIVFINVPPRVCITDTIVVLTATAAGGTWAGPGISGNTFSAATAGLGVHRISYTVTNGSGCTDTRFANIVVNDCLERHNIFQTAIRIWPNPNNGRFSIQFNSDKYKEFKVKIVNAKGQELGYYEFKNLVYGQILPFDLSRLPGGEYFLYVYNTQESGVFPIVIAR